MSQGRLLGRRCFRSGHRDAGLIDDRQQIKLSSCHWRLATQITRGQEPQLPSKFRYAAYTTTGNGHAQGSMAKVMGRVGAALFSKC